MAASASSESMRWPSGTSAAAAAPAGGRFGAGERGGGKFGERRQQFVGEVGRHQRGDEGRLFELVDRILDRIDDVLDRAVGAETRDLAACVDDDFVGLLLDMLRARSHGRAVEGPPRLLLGDEARDAVGDLAR